MKKLNGVKPKKRYATFYEFAGAIHLLTKVEVIKMRSDDLLSSMSEDQLCVEIVDRVEVIVKKALAFVGHPEDPALVHDFTLSSKSMLGLPGEFNLFIHGVEGFVTGKLTFKLKQWDLL